MTTPILYDAVLFDLDGTLIATDRFWIQAARTGARRAFAALGLERDLPAAEDWMSVVGHELSIGFARLFPDLSAEERSAVEDACVEEEHRLLAAGGAALMPGAENLLEELAGFGVRMGVASNCSAAYLEHMIEGVGLGRWVEEARCLDSRGVSSKADMIDDLLEVFGTRSALMVGDRASDRNAAWENGLPHVHCAFGFAGPRETVLAEACIEDLDGLRAVLARRPLWIEEALEAAGLFRPTVRPPFALGITGPPSSGKSLFARDAARLLERRGCPVAVVALEAFRNSSLTTEGEARGKRADPLGGCFDLDALTRHVLEPFTRGETVELERPLHDVYGVATSVPIRVQSDDLLLLEGPYLLDPRLRSRLDRVLHLALPDELVLRRVAGYQARRLGPEALREARSTTLPACRVFEERYQPQALADLVLDASNPMGRAPEVAASTGDGGGGSKELEASPRTRLR